VIYLSFTLKFQPIIILLSAVIGILMGHLGLPSSVMTYLIEIFLIILLFFIFLGVDIMDIKRSFANIRFSLTSLAINFIWTPIFAYSLGKIFLAENLDLQIGFLMLMVTPCTDWYLIFTGMTKGNVPLGSSILPMNLILQILLLPVYLWIFMGSSVSFIPTAMVGGVILVLIIPLFLANSVKFVVGKTAKKDYFYGAISRYGDSMQLLFLCLAIIAMFASQGKILLNNGTLFLRVLFPLVVFFAVNFALALAAGRQLRMPYSDRISLLFTTSARNSPISLAIAAITFPDRPLISLTLVIGPLIELPILSIDSNILNRMMAKHDASSIDK
jgi:ACR3 family arsenite efflux pump ArsB